jgi:succinoglycan biosynthesis protein ExoA
VNEVPKVSVIIPSRNEQWFIRRALESIIANDYAKDGMGILAVDGRSQDGSAALVRDISRGCPFVCLLEDPQNVAPMAFSVRGPPSSVSGEGLFRVLPLECRARLRYIC